MVSFLNLLLLSVTFLCSCPVSDVVPAFCCSSGLLVWSVVSGLFASDQLSLICLHLISLHLISCLWSVCVWSACLIKWWSWSLSGAVFVLRSAERQPSVPLWGKRESAVFPCALWEAATCRILQSPADKTKKVWHRLKCHTFMNDLIGIIFYPLRIP